MPRCLALVTVLLAFSTAIAAEKPRLIVLTDIGGDPDDQQSLIRLMVHANEFEIEGLIASAAGVPGELKTETVKPELIREIVEAYGKVRPNLVKHHPDFPDAKDLLDRIKSGNPMRGTDSLGADKDTDGSNWIISVVDRPDERPVNIAIWGGSTELAQALWRVRKDRTPDQLKAFLGKLRVYDISHQDNTGPWINEQFPDLFYILSKASRGRDKREGGYRGMYLGGDESLTSRDWVDKHVRKDRGPLGALYPAPARGRRRTRTRRSRRATRRRGSTSCQSASATRPTRNGEAGAGDSSTRRAEGTRTPATRSNGITDSRATVWRWRPAYQNEFAARMEWCVKSPKEANHPPVAGFRKDVTGKTRRAGRQARRSRGSVRGRFKRSGRQHAGLPLVRLSRSGHLRR